jgi:hypothetical protein
VEESWIGCLARTATRRLFAAAVTLAACTPSSPSLEKSRPEPPASSAVASAPAPAPTPTPSANRPAAHPAPDSVNPDELCNAFDKRPLPAADVPTPEERKTLAGCDAEALYYGIGRPADFAAARKCAYVQRDLRQPPQIGGVAVLLMIYANGKGVPANLDLAVRFACEGDHANAERNARLERIHSARATGRLESELDFCEDVTSSVLMGWCAGHYERINAAERDAKKRAFTKSLPAAALERLDKAAEAFVDARALKEVDLSGTMRGVFSIGERAKVRQEYVDMLRNLVDPAFSPPAADAAKVEQELQKAYDDLMKCKKSVPRDSPAVQAQGIQKTELAWLEYRTAWLVLVVEARPGANREAWKAWITEKRTKMLQDLQELAYDCRAAP